MLSNLVSYFYPDGTPTEEGIKLWRGVFRRLAALEETPPALSVGAVTGAGTTQATAGASALALIRFEVNTAALTAGNVALIMPAASLGREYRVTNPTTLSLSLFPASGENFQGLAADAALTVPADSMALVVCDLAGRWNYVLT